MWNISSSSSSSGIRLRGVFRFRRFVPLVLFVEISLNGLVETTQSGPPCKECKSHLAGRAKHMDDLEEEVDKAICWWVSSMLRRVGCF